MLIIKPLTGNGFNEEFVYSDAEIQLIDAYSDLTDELHTDLHECLGHGSGKLLPGVDPDALKAYALPSKRRVPICSDCIMWPTRNWWN